MSSSRLRRASPLGTPISKTHVVSLLNMFKSYPEKDISTVRTLNLTRSSAIPSLQIGGLEGQPEPSVAPRSSLNDTSVGERVWGTPPPPRFAVILSEFWNLPGYFFVSPLECNECLHVSMEDTVNLKTHKIAGSSMVVGCLTNSTNHF